MAAMADPDYVAHLRQLARETGAGNRSLVIDNPYDLFPDARASLMSAADVFVHPSTGIEEASPLAVHEAQAHSLPVIVTEPDVLQLYLSADSDHDLPRPHLPEPR
jgi:glycosyltransferase involved in cell wall biosynthesis